MRPIALRTPNSQRFSLMLADIDTRSMKNEIQRAITPIRIVKIWRTEIAVDILSSTAFTLNTSIVLSPTIPLRRFLKSYVI